MAQPGSAPALGAGGREFESRRPDHFTQRHFGPRTWSSTLSTIGNASGMTCFTASRFLLNKPSTPSRLTILTVDASPNRSKPTNTAIKIAKGLRRAFSFTDGSRTPVRWSQLVEITRRQARIQNN